MRHAPRPRQQQYLPVWRRPDGLVPGLYRRLDLLPHAGLERLRDNHVADADGSAASRNFWASNVWYINQYALRELGIAEDAPEFKVGENLSQPIVIAGIYRDFQVGSALDAPTSVLLRVVKNPDDFQPWNILVKTHGDHAAAYRAVEELFHWTTDGATFTGRYVTDEIAADFAAQRRLLHIVGIFTLVALLISSLGLFAMAAYYIQQKRQEIAVRRVFGASRREMLTRLVRSFMALVGVAFVIAVPIAVWGSGAGWRSIACVSHSRRGFSSLPAFLPRLWRCFRSDGRAVAPPMPTLSNRSRTD